MFGLYNITALLLSKPGINQQREKKRKLSLSKSCDPAWEADPHQRNPDAASQKRKHKRWHEMQVVASLIPHWETHTTVLSYMYYHLVAFHCNVKLRSFQPCPSQSCTGCCDWLWCLQSCKMDCEWIQHQNEEKIHFQIELWVTQWQARGR